MAYQYLLSPSPSQNDFTVVHVHSCCHIGSVYSRGEKYRVWNADCDEIGIVKSIGEAIPALLDHYEKHPPPWERDSATQFTKMNQFGLLQVEQDQLGWLAYRYYDDYYHPLLRDGKPATFTTSEEAQHAADAHVRDDYPYSKANDDGLSWSAE